MSDARFNGLILTAAGRNLVFQEFEDVWLAYQRDSGETHVFNEITMAILHELHAGTVSAQELPARVAVQLALAPSELAEIDFLPAIERLEHLGILDWPDARGACP